MTKAYLNPLAPRLPEKKFITSGSETRDSRTRSTDPFDGRTFGCLTDVGTTAAASRRVITEPVLVPSNTLRAFEAHRGHFGSPRQ